MKSKSEKVEKAANEGEIQVMEVEQGIISFCVVGTKPLLHNCLANKAQHELLLPSGPKSRDEKARTLKHVPIDEFRNSPYVNRMKAGPTLIQHVGASFRQAMRCAALDLPGVTKAQVGRMLWVENERVDIFGVPRIDLRPVRQAGIDRTPDIRSRAIQPEWAARITVRFMKPQFKAQAVANLLAAAGFYIGIGDGRNEKGALTFGLWRLCSEDDEEFVRIVSTGGREAQEAAMLDPEPYNDETEKLLMWFETAVKSHRAFDGGTSKANGKSVNADDAAIEESAS